MSVHGSDYQKLVIDDLENTATLTHPIKAGAMERLFVKKISPDKLHPNARDEFSEEAIGPNYEIVSNYVKKLSRDGLEGFGEPLIVEKLSSGGYVILNGHHRWLAAQRIGMKRIPVHIVNLTHREDVLRMMQALNNDICVSFDLDEVLFFDENKPANPSIDEAVHRKITDNKLRKDADELINYFRKKSCDIWVYTGLFYSTESIKKVFKKKNCPVHGIINGLNKQTSGGKLREVFAKKYKIIITIDNEGVICVNSQTGDYEVYEVKTSPDNWAEATAHLFKEEIEEKLSEWLGHE